MANKMTVPRISIVTPSLNQGYFLEETIQSILSQRYPNLEYIVIDGGSTDNSIDILKKYEQHLSYWVSEPDKGQADAINKGFKRSSGDILGWLNSDDMYSEDALNTVGRVFQESGCDVLSGATVYLDSSGKREKFKSPIDVSIERMLKTYSCHFTQPSTFWSRKAWERYGPLDETLHLRMDYAFVLCLKASGLKWILLDDTLAIYRRHTDQKIWSWGDPGVHKERETAIERFASYDDFRQRYQVEILRGLKYEGWLASWFAQNQIYHRGCVNALKAYIAPLYNWRCLVMRLYYRKAFSVTLFIVKKFLKRIGLFP